MVARGFGELESTPLKAAKIEKHGVKSEGEVGEVRAIRQTQVLGPSSF